MKLNNTQIIFNIFLLLVFVLGFYITLTRENFVGGNNDQTQEVDTTCPNMLVQRGQVLLLYNSSKPIVDGENPLPFFNLDEYIHYLEQQRASGSQCPILYLRQEINTQGEQVFRVRPSPFDLQGGLPAAPQLDQEQVTKLDRAFQHLDASRDGETYNTNMYAGFDPQGQHIGEYTDLDAVHDSTKQKSISDNPMDPNWAGVTYTKQMVDSGKYVGNEITKPVYFQPKGTFHPSIPSDKGLPVDLL
jgi:hypothetical protein